ncbi:HAD-IA family hydrolase [Kribbella ginsengisoli]|uniref:protein-tyrosine-phosphatase n=1 Tax=Kribbella ginsengisoli TaxID=363865 RepID=A0ABP6X6F0_9ACTN
MTDLDWNGCLNTRDLAGFSTRYGGVTRGGTMIRTDSPDKLDAAGRVALRGVGAGLVLDLRSDWEMTRTHPLEGVAEYRRIPWIDPVRDKERVPEDEPLLGDIYRGSLDRNQGQIGAALRAVASAPEDRPVVVHCKSGKDRTGLLVALLLDLIGVPRDQIVADYVVSEVRLGVLERAAGLPAEERERALLLSRTLPETITAALDHVDERYGGVRSYLELCGLTAGELHRLAMRLVGSPVEAVVFDFDGLLMDTETTLVKSWQFEWAQHGLELELADDFWPGHGGDTKDARYAQLAALVPDFDREVSQARRTAYRDSLHEDLDFRPGIRDWLLEARELGLRPAIASSSERSWVIGHLERVGALDLFDVIAAGDEVDGHKPDPAVYFLALERLGLSGSATAAVEDTPHGVEAAAAAGMATIAIPNPYVRAAALSAADLTLGSAGELTLSDALLAASRRNAGV